MDLQLIRRSALIVVFATLACASVDAVEVGIGRQAIERAIEIGRRGAVERARFHSRYVIPVGHPTVERFEVITEFRRVVMWTEQRVLAGEHALDARDAEAPLRSWRGRLAIVAHLRFHPQNTYVTVPEYEMSLAGPRASQEILPLDLRRIPKHGDDSIIGADIEAIFDATPLARTARTVVLRLPPGQVAAAAIDFASLD